MNRSTALLLTVAALCAPLQAIDYTALSAVKRLRAEKRYDEALAKLEALAAKTDEPGENFTYLSHAIDVATDSLKNADRALALAATIKDPSLRDFARLKILADFQRYDEALAFIRDKQIATWPLRTRAEAYSILAEIHHARKDAAAELAQWQLCAATPGAQVGVRGRALRESGALYLKQGDTQKAEQAFREALTVSPANFTWRVESLVALSRLLVESQRPRDAVKAFDGTDFTKVTSITAKGNLHEAYARALLAAGKKIKAIETFDQLLQLDIPPAWKDRINKELDKMAEDF